MIRHQFKKGNIPWNKGLKGVMKPNKTSFKSDGSNTGSNHNSWKGGIQNTKKDGKYIWLDTKKREPLSRYVYKLHYGSIPKGYVIYHIDGNKLNNNINNLIAITRRELLKWNNKMKKN